MTTTPGEPWASTKGLTVYNALQATKRDLTIPELLAFVRIAFDQSYPVEWIEQGVAFLKEREFVKHETGMKVTATLRREDGLCRTLIRASDDAELTYGAGWGVM